MAHDYVPRREAELLTWSANLRGKLLADPEVYGVTAAQAVAYEALHAAFAAAHARANNPALRSPVNVIAKDKAKDALVAQARVLAGLIQAQPQVTAERKAELGLTVRDRRPSAVAAPTVAPVVDVVGVTGRRVALRLHDADNITRRAKPQGVAGATIFIHIGEAPPADLADWTFAGNATRTRLAVTFPETAPAGAKVWITARWYNRRAQPGPTATQPATTHLQHGGVVVSAA